MAPPPAEPVPVPPAAEPFEEPLELDELAAALGAAATADADAGEPAALGDDAAFEVEPESQADRAMTAGRETAPSSAALTMERMEVLRWMLES